MPKEVQESAIVRAFVEQFHPVFELAKLMLKALRFEKPELSAKLLVPLTFFLISPLHWLTIFLPLILMCISFYAGYRNFRLNLDIFTLEMSYTQYHENLQLYFQLASCIDSAKESVNKNLLNGSKSRTRRTRLVLLKYLLLTNLMLFVIPLNMAVILCMWYYTLSHSLLCNMVIDVLFLNPVPKVLKIAYESTCFTIHMCLPWVLGKKTANQVVSALVNSRFQDTWFLKLFHKLGVFLSTDEVDSENEGYVSSDSIDKDCDIDIGSDYEKITDQITIEESFIEQASKTSRGLGEKSASSTIPKKSNTMIKLKNYN